MSVIFSARWSMSGSNGRVRGFSLEALSGRPGNTRHGQDVVVNFEKEEVFIEHDGTETNSVADVSRKHARWRSKGAGTMQLRSIVN